MSTGEELFRDFYAEHHRDIWRYCLRRVNTPQDAEDVFNSTFVVAWNKFDDVPDGDQARPWLFVVARNEIRNSRRRSDRYGKLKQRMLGHRNLVPPSDPADLASSGQQHVRDALGRLRSKDRELLMLAAWEGLSQNEIGRVLDCSENAVAIRLHRARTRLAKELGSSSQMTMKDSPATRRVAEQGPSDLGKGAS